VTKGTPVHYVAPDGGQFVATLLADGDGALDLCVRTPRMPTFKRNVPHAETLTPGHWTPIATETP